MVLGVEHLPRTVCGVQRPGDTSRAAPAPLESLDAVERRAIAEALERFEGNKSRVAEHLGIGRTTLWRRMKALGL